MLFDDLLIIMKDRLLYFSMPVSFMSDLIGYHGTKDLEGILKNEAILPAYYLEGGEEYWKKKKAEYDLLGGKLASAIRGLEGGRFLHERHPNITKNDALLKNDELLASIYVKYSGSPLDESRAYEKLALGLTIYLAGKFDYARPYVGRHQPKKIGALLQLIVPKILLRSSNYFDYIHFQFMGKLDLKYLEKIFISKNDFEKAKEFLHEPHLKILELSGKEL